MRKMGELLERPGLRMILWGLEQDISAGAGMIYLFQKLTWA